MPSYNVIVSRLKPQLWAICPAACQGRGNFLWRAAAAPASTAHDGSGGGSPPYGMPEHNAHNAANDDCAASAHKHDTMSRRP